MTKIYRFINFFFKLFFFIYSILILIKNIKKIRSYKNIIYQKAGGFGHTIITANYIKYLTQIEKSSVLLIQQFDISRHNKYLLKSINIPHLTLIRSFSDVFFNKYIVFGKQEDKNIFSHYNKTFIKLILLIKKKDTKLKTEQELYSEIINKHYPNKYSQKNEPKHRHKSCCLYYLSDFTEPLKLVNYLKIKIESKINYLKKELNKEKLVTIYIRYRKANDNFFNQPRNNNLDDYIKLINFLNEQNYLVLLIGDLTHFDLEKIKNIYTAKILKVNKDSFDIFSTTEVDLFIGTEGGAQNLAVQLNTKKLSVNHFPYGHKTKNTEILYKKIVYKGNLLSEDDCVSKINFERYLDNNYIIKDNTPNEILNFVKKNIS